MAPALLTPMSEIAGRLSIQVGAWCLQARTAGGHSSRRASGVGRVQVVFSAPAWPARLPGRSRHGRLRQHSGHQSTKLRYVHDILGSHVTTLMSNRATLKKKSSMRTCHRLGAHSGAKAPNLFPFFSATDEAGLGVCGYFHRSGRLCRELPAPPRISSRSTWKKTSFIIA
jgi:hypothetical protein